MKKNFLTVVLITIALTLFAQTPQVFKYQTVVRDNSGNVQVNKSVSFQISILQGSPTGTNIYTETHFTVTNDFGLVNLKIGNGEIFFGTIEEIDWENGPYFLQVKMDETGGTNWVLMGTSQLLSVPYAQFSDFTGDTTRWRKNNNNLYYNNGRIGIGTHSPLPWTKLDIRGNLSVDGKTVISNMAVGQETVLNLSNTTSNWELVAASDNNRFDIRKWSEVPAFSVSDNNYVGIGTTSPSGILDIAGIYHFPSVDGSTGQVLKTDGSGTLSWSSGSGATQIDELSDGKTGGFSVFLGWGAGLNDYGTDNKNVGVGFDALFHNTTGETNTANGYVALLSNTTGDGNTANGAWTLSSNTIGYSNTAIGIRSLTSNTTGFENTAVGYKTLLTSTSGYANTAIGMAVLKNNSTGDQNTGIGNLALLSNETGSNNVACGTHALSDNETGDANSAYGYYALEENITGHYNTAVGTWAGPYNDDNLSNTTALGNLATIAADNQVRFGNSSVTSIGGYANWTNISDSRFKKNIKKNIPGLDFILQLEPVSYQLDVEKINDFLGIPDSLRNDEISKQGVREKEAEIQTGFIAQDVEEAALSIGYDFSGVDAPKNEHDTYGLRYAEFVVPLVKAVQELAQENEELRQRIEMLENQN